MGDLDFFDPRHYADIDQTPGYEVEKELQFGMRENAAELVALRALYAEYYRDGVAPTGYAQALLAIAKSNPYDYEDEGEVTIDLRTRGLV